MVCPACGAALPEGAAFCFKCGRPQPTAVVTSHGDTTLRSVDAPHGTDGKDGVECEIAYRGDAVNARYEAVVHGAHGTSFVADEEAIRSNSDGARRSACATLVIRLAISGWERLPADDPQALPRFRWSGGTGLVPPGSDGRLPAAQVDLMRRTYGRASAPPTNATPTTSAKRSLWTPTIPVTDTIASYERERSPLAWAAVAVAVVVFLGSFGTWVTAQFLFAVSSESGMDGPGRLTLMLALLAGGLMVWIGAKPSTRPLAAVIAAVAFGLTVIIGFYFMAATSTVAGQVPVSMQIGWGAWLVILGGIAGTILCGIEAKQARSASAIRP